MKPEAGESLPKRIGARVRREGRLIQRALRDRRHPHRSVHEARKAIRRLRALLALLQTRQASAALAEVDGRLQRLGDSLSLLRDAQVAVETAQRFARHGPDASRQQVIAWLIQRRDGLLARALRRDHDFAFRQALLHHCMRVLDDMDWDPVGKRELRDALHRSQRRVDKAARKAREAPSAEHIHRWRRRLRRLRMQLEILRGIAPGLVHGEDHAASGKHIRALRKESDRLGRLQDLQALHRLIRRMPATFDREILLRRIVRQIESTG